MPEKEEPLLTRAKLRELKKAEKRRHPFRKPLKETEQVVKSVREESEEAATATKEVVSSKEPSRVRETEKTKVRGSFLNKAIIIVILLLVLAIIAIVKL